jgi:uncharacterized protein (TIGR04222 family)
MNQLSQQELWEKIQTFKLDDPTSAFPFSKKLAKENNWTALFTNRAIEEYKKFIFLCCISPTGASPSEVVDEVWHMHLTYTDNYWNQFCKQTLAKEIHHHPSKGGNAENEKHTNWYEDTLKLYEKQFHNKPPADIWPEEQLLTADINEPIYDPAFFKTLLIIFLIAVVVFIAATNLFHLNGDDFLNYYFLLCAGGLIALFISQRHKDEKLKRIIDQNFPQKTNPYQMARFLYGVRRCYQTALVDLLQRGIIATHGNDYKITGHLLHITEKEDNPLLQALQQNFTTGDTFTYNDGLGLIDRDTVVHKDIERLYRLSQKVDYQKLIIPGIVLLIGFARFLQGMANEKPVGFLVFEIGVFGVLSLVILQSYSYTKSIRQHLGLYWQAQNNEGFSGNVINNFTILGATAIAGFAEYSTLKNVFNSFDSKEKKWGTGGEGSSGCSSSAGCSSGGDGGSGCGSSGCGGCGGGD